MALESDDQSLETLLRAVPLREPGAGMDARVNAVFADHRTGNSALRAAAKKEIWNYDFRRFSLYRIGVHRLAIAAGILLAIGIGVRLSLPKPQPPLAIAPSTVESHPIQFEQDTATTIDDGIIASGDDGAYVQTRRRMVRQIWYEDPQTHAKLQITIPSEQVIVEKVEAY